jgi:hypothetical protein
VPAAVGGRWEGTTEVMRPRCPPTRVLVIRNLRADTAGPDAAKWKGEGLYGATADKMGRVDLTVTAAGLTVTVEFVTSEALHVTAGGRPRRMHLERCE